LEGAPVSFLCVRIAPEIRSIVTVRTAALLAGVTLLTCHGYRPKVAMRESKPGYPILKPEDVARVPVIIEGLVIESGAPVSTVQRSPIDGGFTQLWKGRVRVENVLQGRVSEGIIDIFYFVGDIPGSSRRILFRPGERNLFFLRWDGPYLPTTNHRSANACLLKVLTGPHPNFNRAPGASINDAIIRLLLTRGNGADDQQMIGAVEDPKYWRALCPSRRSLALCGELCASKRRSSGKQHVRSLFGWYIPAQVKLRH
jgi:hypothetical protein